MPRGPTVRQADIDRAVRTILAAGMAVDRIEVHAGGAVHVIPRAAASLTPPSPANQGDTLDDWRARRAARSAEGT